MGCAAALSANASSNLSFAVGGVVSGFFTSENFNVSARLRLRSIPPN